MSLAKAKITGQYTNSVLAKREAKLAGYDEAIMLDTQGYVSEGSGENIFIVKNGRILTPDFSSSILGGITRDTVITLAREEGIPLDECRITRDKLWLADEAFFTGTAAEVTPIREVDNRSDRRRQTRTDHAAPAKALLRHRSRQRHVAPRVAHAKSVALFGCSLGCGWRRRAARPPPAPRSGARRVHRGRPDATLSTRRASASPFRSRTARAGASSITSFRSCARRTRELTRSSSSRSGTKTSS